MERQHHAGRAWATINRRLNALKHFFAFCVEQQLVRGNPVKPSHFVRRGHPLPKALSREQVQRLFAQIAHPMDRALFLVILRCGLRVSEVADLKLEQIDWEQQAVHMVQGKGRKDRRVYMSPDAVVSVQQCLEQHPGARAQGYVFWNRGFHVRRDKLPSIAYAEELISFAMSTSLQSTDRHHGIVGQEHGHFQRDA